MRWHWTAPEIGDWTRARVWIPLAALVGLYLVIQWAVLPPIHWGDTLRVFRYAAAWPDVPTDHHALRIGLLLPTRIAQEVLGYGQAAFYVVAFSAGVGLVVGMYAAGRALFGQLAAVASTVVMVTSPHVVNTERFLTSGLILPDLPSAAVFTLGIAVLLHGLHQESERTQRGLFVAAGVLFAGAYLIREFTPAMYVVVPAALLLWKVPLRRLMWIAAPMLALWLGESLVNAAVHGDPLIRLRVSSEHGAILAQERTPADTFRLWLRAFTDSSRGQLLLVMLGLNVLGVVLFRDRRLILTLLWFGSLFLALLALGGLLDPASPSLRIVLTRYWFPVFPALVLGGVGTIALGLERLLIRGSWRAAATISGVTVVWLLVTIIGPAAVQAITSDRDRPWIELRAWLDEEGVAYETMWTDSRTDLMLDVYRYRPIGGETVWDGEINEFRHDLAEPPWHDIGDAPVLYAPQGPTEPAPTSAQELFRSSDGSLAVVVDP